MSSAEAQSSAIKLAIQEDMGALAALAAAEDGAARSPKPDRAIVKKGKAVSKAARPSVLANPPKGLSAAVRSADHMRSIPAHTPLSSVLAQFKEAETAWAHDKARLRREALEERKRANKLELECKRHQRALEHQALDIKALRTALKSRDSQLEAATQEDAALTIANLNAEREDLKGMLAAALQRLEAVDEMVQRADISSAMMEDKMRMLEEERTKALDAAARARTEVAELAESRRKLQWQSKLLEKMSEVQLKHNKRKSEAIRRLLSAEEHGQAHSGDLAPTESELLDDA
ncbi:hypothetical protein GPECTOR_10g1098 [Gonium pectorale]|uniref:Uncharacterized protein n=1 Tax=Gonium pectorale TaxID=33097 RepID=A0A150GQH6_GONPE|nr:hypothetical protein GPECTOR_10g1098 [Gonium pectorale]|eukprot:KXZ52075.1 hypothetical protein GPECTOR_10g1098 [Gonium pectorale]